jgi:hypothetical protein
MGCVPGKFCLLIKTSSNCDMTDWGYCSITARQVKKNYINIKYFYNWNTIIISILRVCTYI